ncbi:MAG TPA: hypothetical protein VHE81_19565, partial [Lacipirellulaceae bacterium]|nr:hypothetical protein [Lacipirellulaceae bacterium]
MDGRTTPIRSRCSTSLIFVFATVACSTRAENTPPHPPEKPQIPTIIGAFRNDAALNDMAFVNQSTGWAVGDRGVIWCTHDGGNTWR